MKDFYITVFGKKLKVEFTESKNLESSHGAYSHIDNKIYINVKNTQKKDYLQVFIHEYCHFVLDRLGFYTTSISSDIEELIVENISMALSESFYNGDLDGILEISRKEKNRNDKQLRKRKKTYKR